MANLPELPDLDEVFGEVDGDWADQVEEMVDEGNPVSDGSIPPANTPESAPSTPEGSEASDSEGASTPRTSSSIDSENPPAPQN